MPPEGYCDDVDKLPELLEEVERTDADAAATEATEREDTEATDADETKEPVDKVASTELGKAVSEDMHRVVWVRMRGEEHILRMNYSRTPVNIGSLLSPWCTRAVEGMITKYNGNDWLWFGCMFVPAAPQKVSLARTWMEP